jgi:hypothetical protein
MLAGTVGVHDEDLVALVRRPRGLEDQAAAIGRPVSFGVLTAVSELQCVAQVRVSRDGRNRRERQTTSVSKHSIHFMRTRASVSQQALDLSGDIFDLGQDFVFDLRLVGDPGIQGGHAAHGRV